MNPSALINLAFWKSEHTLRHDSESTRSMHSMSRWNTRSLLAKTHYEGATIYRGRVMVCMIMKGDGVRKGKGPWPVSRKLWGANREMWWTFLIPLRKMEVSTIPQLWIPFHLFREKTHPFSLSAVNAETEVLRGHGIVPFAALFSAAEPCTWDRALQW